MDNIEVYGFSGKLKTGKDYVSQAFAAMLPDRPTLFIALADHFKVECCAKDGVEYERIYGPKDDESRRLLQTRGTEEGRDVFGHDIWCKILSTWIRVHADRGIERFIVTDVRFPNEAEWLREHFGAKIIRVVADDRNLAASIAESRGNEDIRNAIVEHPSETALDEYDQFDYYVDNSIEMGVDRSTTDNITERHTLPLSLQLREICEAEVHPKEVVVFIDLDDTICECSKYYSAAEQDAISLIKSSDPKLGALNDTIYEEALEIFSRSYADRVFDREDFANALCSIYSYICEGVEIQPDASLSKTIYALGMSVHDSPFEEIEGSIAAVRAFESAAQVVIFTMGERMDQMRKLVNLGLHGLPIEIFLRKEISVFKYLKKKYPANMYVMIGDSHSSDIIPAICAGLDMVVHITRGISTDANMSCADLTEAYESLTRCGII